MTVDKLRSQREPTHAEVVDYYAKLGLLAETDSNETQAALDAANAAALSVREPSEPTKAKPRKPALEKGSAAAKERMAKIRAARGKTIKAKKEQT